MPHSALSLCAAAMLLSMTAASSLSLAADGTYRAYVGTYTGAKSEGIYTFEFNAGTGSATKVELAAKTENPSFVAVHPSGKWLYAVSEISEFRGEKAGAMPAVGEAAEHYLAEFSWIALLVVLLAVIGFSVRARLRRSPR